MIRTQIAFLVAALGLSAGCAGTFGAHGSVSVRADIHVPVADMPPKYASWVVEAEGYLNAVNEAYARFVQSRADLAAALGVEANGQVIARFIHDSIQVRTEMVCQPPSFNASLVADCRGEANARAAGKAHNGQASGDAAGGIQANCQAMGSLRLTPGSCTMKTTVSQHPILSDAARWATIESNMKIILQLSAANAHLEGRGAGINSRGHELHAASVNDLAADPTLAVHLNEIQVELDKGAKAVGEANDKQSAMNSELGIMTNAIDGQFPSLRAAVSVR